MKFSDLGLSPEVLRAVEEAGYVQPTPIQEKAIPIVLQGRDVMGSAQTGTGKTASFALPMIDILASGRARARMPRALILEPTRELAAQVAEAFIAYGKYSQLQMALLIGGTSMDEQSRKLEGDIDIVIATPGRLLDHADRGHVMLRGVKILVIDETDRMLDMGFIPDVQRIVKLLPPLRQTLFFSATLNDEIRRIGKDFVSNPKEIAVAPPSSAAVTIRQALIMVSADDKRDAVRKLIESEKITQSIIFLNRKRDVDILVRSLVKNGLSAAPIHGDLAQSLRTDTLEKFKAGSIKYLVASDVAARGIDIEALPSVINYDVPISAEDYVHRIGRTARAGREGTAYTLATPDDGRLLAAIAKLVGKEIPLMTLEGVAAPAPLAEGEEPRRGGRVRGGRRPASSAAPAAPKPASEGGRGRSRRRSGSSEPAPAGVAEAPAEPMAEPIAAPAMVAMESAVPEPVAVAMEPDAAAPHADAAPAPQQVGTGEPKRSRGRRGGRGRRREGGDAAPASAGSSPAPAPAMAAAPVKHQPVRSHDTDNRDDMPHVLTPSEPKPGAMGGHVPAFLLRPVVLKR